MNPNLLYDTLTINVLFEKVSQIAVILPIDVSNFPLNTIKRGWIIIFWTVLAKKSLEKLDAYVWSFLPS